METKHHFFMSKAIELAKKGVGSNAGGPFGVVIVKNGKIIAEGYNKVTSKKNLRPTQKLWQLEKRVKN